MLCTHAQEGSHALYITSYTSQTGDLTLSGVSLTCSESDGVLGAHIPVRTSTDFMRAVAAASQYASPTIFSMASSVSVEAVLGTWPQPPPALHASTLRVTLEGAAANTVLDLRMSGHLMTGAQGVLLRMERMWVVNACTKQVAIDVASGSRIPMASPVWALSTVTTQNTSSMRPLFSDSTVTVGAVGLQLITYWAALWNTQANFPDLSQFFHPALMSSLLGYIPNSAAPPPGILSITKRSITFSSLGSAYLRGSGLTLTTAMPPTASLPAGTDSQAMAATDCDTGGALPPAALSVARNMAPVWLADDGRQLLDILQQASLATKQTPAQLPFMPPMIVVTANIVVADNLASFGIELAADTLLLGTPDAAASLVSLDLSADAGSVAIIGDGRVLIRRLWLRNLPARAPTTTSNASRRKVLQQAGIVALALPMWFFDASRASK